jgi:cysteine-rich repeat protein
MCKLSHCGDGKINGGELCDDNNTKSGDGCSSICLIENNYTCIGVPSACFAVLTGNLSLLSVSANTNNVYIKLQTSQNILFSNRILAGTFFQIVFLNTVIGATSYCQQEDNLNQFVCLLIYPYGTPNDRTFILFKYNFQGLLGANIVELPRPGTTSFI